MMKLHLDVLGGIAGDMFIAAVLDAFPEHEAPMLGSIKAVSALGLECELVAHDDGVFRGRQFHVRAQAVDGAGESAPRPSHDHHHHGPGQGHDHIHHHTPEPDPPNGQAQDSWRAIRARIAGAGLEDGVKAHALGIFTHLADAEARVHGVSVEDVRFHEVGAWDSIADIVGAGHLIAALGADRWTTSTLPLGSGRVRTAHGLMPVPAPATALLLQGFGFIDDGAPGERITPTGAAILRHLCDPTAVRPLGEPAILSRSGVGFGTRRLQGVSNCLRLLVFEERTLDVQTADAPPRDAGPSHRDLLVIEFEVDDQSAEDLAMGLDQLRRHPAVFDAIQAPVFGKKGRMMTHVRLLTRSDALHGVSEAVFRETTTIGLRHHRVGGAALPRRSVETDVGDRRVRVKAVDRPGGRTAKAEADDVAAVRTHGERSRFRREAERATLAGLELAGFPSGEEDAT